MGKQKTLVLIDGHALAFRQYYALERTNMRTSDGTPTWAVYGFFKAIFDLLKNIKPDSICVAFDVSHHTFRVDEYAEYKSNRVAMPDDMQTQMELIYEGLRAFDIPIYTKEGFEADDVIGTISKKACELGHKILILTGDQDSFQLIDKNGCIKVILPTKGILKEFGWKEVYEKLGIYPDQVVDYKSLRGDVSDNIPGVKGIGEKTALKLLKEYGHLDNVLANCQNMPESNVKKCLCNDIEMAKKSYLLATIVRNVDIDFDFESTKLNLPNLSNVTAFLKSMQFLTFLKNIDSILANFTKTENVQLGLFSSAIKEEINKVDDVKAEIVDKNFEDLIAVLRNQKIISFELLFSKGDFWGISFGYNDGEFKSFCVLQSQCNVLEVFKTILEDVNIKKVLHDAKKQYDYLYANGITLCGLDFDTLLASYVKDASNNHNLESQAMENIDYLIDIKEFEDLSQELAIQQACNIAVTILRLRDFWLKELNEKELKLLYDVEIPLTLVLAKMECVGVSIDKNYMKELSDYIDRLILKLEEKIYELAGATFNIASPKQVGEILFDTLELKTKKKRKNRYSTSAEVLEELAEDNEIVRLILKYRKYSKLKSTYTDALPALINPNDGRIHTTYNQTTTVTGRLSSSNPNLQNIPIRTEEGNKIRKAFVPKDRNNAVILSADYSQIELRLLAHVAQDKNLIEAFNSGEDVHAITASKVFNVPLNEVTKEMRYKSKAVNFGIIYGQSKYGLAKALGISAGEAENFINKYFELYPAIKKYMDNIVKFADKNGYVETMLGRRRYLDVELTSSIFMVREFAKRAAINHPMQGSAADLIKMAMIRLDKDLDNMKSKLIIQVHDELVIETYKSELEEVKAKVIKAMELDQPLLVPLVVDINVGETWQEL